jgi:hypothetical protein
MIIVEDDFLTDLIVEDDKVIARIHYETGRADFPRNQDRIREAIAAASE